MYKTCPKCQYQRQPEDPGDGQSCPACGIIFSKWMKQQFASAQTLTVTEPVTASIVRDIPRRIIRALLHVEDKVNPFIFWGRCVVYIALVIWGWKFIQMDFIQHPTEIGYSFMHRINLVFHEAGHILFMPFGWLMTKLGGTLGQLLMPIVVTIAFIVKNHNPFAASVGLWWLGQSFMDCAPYIDDALDQNLVLLGGFTGADRPGYHDWSNILGNFNVLEKHRIYATFADTAGTVIMLIAFIWGGYILSKQFKNIDSF